MSSQPVNNEELARKADREDSHTDLDVEGVDNDSSDEDDYNEEDDDDDERRNDHDYDANEDSKGDKKTKLSREEIQEFKIAFSMCADNESQDVLHKDKLEEFFITLGYSLSPHNIQRLLVDFPPDSDGLLSLESMKEAYDAWKNKEIKTAELDRVFKQIVKNNQNTEKDGGEACIDADTMKSLLREVCHDPNISLEDAKAVIAEVDSKGEGLINLVDFYRMISLG